MREAAKKILDRLYPGYDAFKFSYGAGWNCSTSSMASVRHGFGGSGSVNTYAVANSLPRLRDTLNKFQWKDIYNMDETGLLFRMQVRAVVVCAFDG